MSKTSIEWATVSWNPTLGCSKVSPGCDNCYAVNVARRGMQEAHRGLTLGDDWTGEVRELEERLTDPMAWKQPERVFVDSMSDLFHPDVSDAFRLDVWQTMAATQRHTYMILTKRPQLMARFSRRLAWTDEPGYWEPYLTGDPIACTHFRGRTLDAVEEPPPNVWLGTSIESDRYAFRADHLRATKAAVRFLSCEPLLGPLYNLDLTGIDWVIAGGESGPRARPAHPDWFRDLRDRCAAAGVPFFFKQHGEWIEHRRRLDPRARFAWVSSINGAVIEDVNARRHGSHWALMRRVGTKAAGHQLDGRVHQDYPTPKPGTRWAA